MHVFVDESGDAGRRVTAGSTEHFTVTWVIVEDEIARDLESCIAQVRRDLNKPDNFEFHFKDNSNSIRQAFLEAVARHRFRYFSCVIDKREYYEGGLPDGKAFYRWTCGQVFEAAKSYLQEAHVVLDQHSEREFVREISIYLKKQMNAQGEEVATLKSITAQTSKSHNLLQLADMVCGAVARSYHSGRDEPQRFRKMIKHREVSVLTLP